MGRHMISTIATPRTCPGCAAPILTATDEGMPTRADATPISNAEEITALLAGLWTYTRTSSGYLIHREPAHIRTGSPSGTIHAQHRCPTPTLI